MKICIDPAHGLPDTGYVGSLVKEANVNLIIALKLKDELIKRGHTVVLTRKSFEVPTKFKDIGDLKVRCMIANKENADLFLSIHCIYTKDTNKNGIVLYEKNSNNYKLAKNLKKCIDLSIDGDCSLRQADIYVFNNTIMPSFLIGIANIASIEQEKLITDSSWQENLVSCLCDSICNKTDTKPRPKSTHLVMGKNLALKHQMEAYLHRFNPAAPYLSEYYLKISELEGVRGDIAFSQSIYLTNYFRFTNEPSSNYNNYAMIKNQQSNKYIRFTSPQQGILAHIQLLKAYASNKSFKQSQIIDDMSYIERGNASSWEELESKWYNNEKGSTDKIILIWKDILRIPEKEMYDFPGVPLR